MVDTHLLQKTGILLNHTTVRPPLLAVVEIAVSFISTSANQKDLQVLDMLRYAIYVTIG